MSRIRIPFSIAAFAVLATPFWAAFCARPAAAQTPQTPASQPAAAEPALPKGLKTPGVARPLSDIKSTEIYSVAGTPHRSARGCTASCGDWPGLRTVRAS